MIKGIIFDLDGTVLSTLEDIQDSLNAVLERNGFSSRDYDQVRMGIGNGSRVLIRKSLPENTDEETIDRVAKEFVEEYVQHYNVKSRPYEGIKELLSKLQQKGIKMAINSNKPDRITQMIISESFPEISFVEVIGQKEGVPRKPDPITAEATIESMGLNKEEILYIGDSETDIKTARNAGLASVGCLWGFRDLKTLQESGAEHIVSRPEEILVFIGEE